MKDKVRIGFVGVGTMGQMAHLRNYVVNPDCEVVAVAELRENTGRAVAKRYAVPTYYPSAGELLAHEKLDAVVAVQPFTRHGIILEEILTAGVPVITEKPLASSIAVGEKIAALVRNSGTFLMVGYHKRSDPATMFAKETIHELMAGGELGALTYVRILMPAGDWVSAGFDGLISEADGELSLDSDPPAPDLSDPGREDYIAFVNYYIHQVNLLRHLLGESYEPVYADPAGTLMVGRSASGKSCTLEMSPFRTTQDWQEEALICFERGWIRLELPAPLAVNRPGRVTIFRDPGKGATPTTSTPTLPPVHAMKQQAANFLAAVRGDRPPMTTADEALEDLRVAREYLRLYKGV